jgi:hypothetical protein
MRLHVKILGLFYSAFGGLLAFFVLLLLLMQALTSLGIMKDDGKKSPGMFVALGISVLLLTVASWLFQTGMGLWNFKAGSRLVALVVGGILMFLLNLALMFTNDPPSKARPGMTFFHVTCIVFGLYTLLVLWPKWGRQLFE